MKFYCIVNRTALDIAKKKKNYEVVQLLLSHDESNIFNNSNEENK